MRSVESPYLPAALPGKRFVTLGIVPGRNAEPGQHGWRRFICLLFIYMTFEGVLRRSLPLYNLQVLLLKDAALAIFYAYYLLCVYPTLPRWRNRDRLMTVLAFLFAGVNAMGMARVGHYGMIPVVLGLKANFWYVPMFFIGRRYFTSFRQIRQFWSRLAWLLVPVLIVAIWQLFFGSFSPLAVPTGTVDAASWAAAGAGTLRNNTDGTLIATVASTFYGSRLALFAAVWLVLMTVLCITDHNRVSFLRLPYMYVAFACALVSVFVSANRTAVGLSIFCVAILVAGAGIRQSSRFLTRLAAIGALAAMVAVSCRTVLPYDAVENKLHEFSAFFSGLLDAPSRDVQGSRYSVIGADIIRGIEFSLAEAGPFGRGLGLITQGAVYINAEAQPVFDVQKSRDAQADSQWVRLIIELGIPGLVLYLAIAFRLLWRALRETIRVRRGSRMDGLTAALGPLLLFLYLGFAHKHAGFAIDPMLQCYVFFTAGAVLGVAAREGSSPQGRPLATPAFPGV